MAQIPTRKIVYLLCLLAQLALGFLALYVLQNLYATLAVMAVAGVLLHRFVLGASWVKSLTTSILVTALVAGAAVAYAVMYLPFG